MKYFIVNTLPRENEQAKAVLSEFSKISDEVEVFYTDEMNIHYCIGCNDCWLKTPGICSIKDDYEKILINFLQFDRTIFIADTKMGFISYKAKNIFDRVLPLATMHLHPVNGQMRHYLRYKKGLNSGLLFIGDADKNYLNEWFDRAVLNLQGKSFGAHKLEDWKELFNELNNN